MQQQILEGLLSGLRVGQSIAAVCRRGHVVEPNLSPRTWVEQSAATSSTNYPEKCTDCGAVVLTACISCGQPLPGGRPPLYEYRVRPFCACGAAMPWATRKERLYELQNIIEEREALSEADRLLVNEQIEALAREDLPEKQQNRAWQAIQRASPELMGYGGEIVLTLMSEWVREKLVGKK
ncbi:DUF2321 domain-containing protein [Streptomyces sp. NPDC088196]|uniref:DUF2321 domain-containing protein n=1 Tax=Streptomyces sp. NPDC088196 TaxID=3154868 RepID=UPI00344BAD32